MTRISFPGNTPRTHEVRRIGNKLPIHDALSQVTKDEVNRWNAEFSDLPANLYVQADIDDLCKCKTTVELLAATLDPTIDALHRHVELMRRKQILLVEMEKQLEQHRVELLKLKDDEAETVAHVTAVGSNVGVTTPTLQRIESRLDRATVMTTADCVDSVRGRQLEAAQEQLRDFSAKIRRLAESPQ